MDRTRGLAKALALIDSRARGSFANEPKNVDVAVRDPKAVSLALS